MLHKKLKKWTRVCVSFRIKWRCSKQKIFMTRERFSMSYIFLEKKIAKARRTGRKPKHPSDLDKKLDFELV